jgi:hypothetical protein
MASSDYLSSLSSTNLFDLPISIGRQNPVPLDASSIFPSFESAEIYAKDNTVSYVGQIITVIENNKITNYQIINENGDLSELVNASEIENKINTLSESISNINIDSINNIDDIKNILSSIVTSLKNFSK